MSLIVCMSGPTNGRKDQLDSHARLSMPLLTPYIFVQPHRRWETYLICEMQVTLNETARFEISVPLAFERCHTICLACARVYANCDITRMNIPQKVIVVESWKCDTMPKNTQFRLTPGNGYLYCNWRNFHMWSQNCGYCTIFRPGLLLCAHNPKFEFALAVI